MDAIGIGDLSSLDRKKTLKTLITGCSGLTAGYVLCSFLVASTANNGFNAVLTGLVYIGHCAGAWHVTQSIKTPIGVGFLIGVSAMLVVLSLETAIFWGQLSNCESVTESIDQYSCDSKAAYSATCAFAALLFLFQGALTAGLVAWKDELIAEDPGYQDLSEQLTGNGIGGADAEYSAYDGGAYTAKSADI